MCLLSVFSCSICFWVNSTAALIALHAVQLKELTALHRVLSGHFVVVWQSCENYTAAATRSSSFSLTSHLCVTHLDIAFTGQGEERSAPSLKLHKMTASLHLLKFNSKLIVWYFIKWVGHDCSVFGDEYLTLMYFLLFNFSLHHCTDALYLCSGRAWCATAGSCSLPTGAQC